jgi:hypothetical protein
MRKVGRLKPRVVTQTMTQTPWLRELALSKLLGELVDLVGIEPTTSSISMPWNDENSNSLTAKALIVGRVGKNR